MSRETPTFQVPCWSIRTELCRFSPCILQLQTAAQGTAVLMLGGLLLAMLSALLHTQ